MLSALVLSTHPFELRVPNLLVSIFIPTHVTNSPRSTIIVVVREWDELMAFEIPYQSVDSPLDAGNVFRMKR
jgi:hypothetical protein